MLKASEARAGLGLQRGCIPLIRKRFEVPEPLRFQLWLGFLFRPPETSSFRRRSVLTSLLEAPSR
jgi:hypothetical protein